MLPTELPPGIMDALSGGAGAGGDPTAPPDEIEVTHADEQGASEDTGEEISPADHLKIAIEHAQAALTGEPDDSHSAKLAKLVQGLYAALADEQDSHMEAMGGKPKELRALHKMYGGPVPVPAGGGGVGGGAPEGGPGGGEGEGA